MPRVSLRKIDSLLNGELGEEESGRLRQEIEASQAAKAYFDRQKDLRSALTWNGLRQAVERDESSGLRGWFRRLVRFPQAPIRSGWPRPAFASGLLALLALGAVWWTVREPGDKGAHGRFTAKGAPFAEAQLQVRGQGYPAGALIAAGPGDTLGFLYRSGDTAYVQVWYKEEGGELRSFAGKDPRGFVWPPATAWIAAPQRILLDGAWRHQEVWIVLSPQSLETERVRKALSGKAGNGVRILPFRLARGS